MDLKLNRHAKTPSLKDYRKKDINLLPDEIRVQKKQTTFFSLLLICILLSALLVGTNYIQSKQAIKRIEEEIELERTKIANLKTSESLYGILSTHVTRIEYKDHILNDLDSLNHSPIKVFKLLEDSTPKDVIYLSVNFNSENLVQINGKSNSKESIADFLYNLKKVTVDKNKFYTKVFVSQISESSDGTKTSNEYQFNIKCEFGGANNE